MNGMPKKHIVKRQGHEEHFDERKVYASCYSACLSAHVRRKEAEFICDKVTREVKSWIRSKGEVTSNQIFKRTATAMKKHHKDAAFMYATHRDIS